MRDAATGPISEAVVPAAMPARYLGQLCEHFRHKPPVTLEERQDRIAFPAGRCEVQVAVGNGAVRMRAIAGDPADLASLADVPARHLRRFVFREDAQVRWTRTG